MCPDKLLYGESVIRSVSLYNTAVCQRVTRGVIEDPQRITSVLNGVVYWRRGMRSRVVPPLYPP